jgi:hypothetical protein
MTKSPKRPSDINQLAKHLVDLATGQQPSLSTGSPQKNPAAVELGRRGGLKGGKARAKALSANQRKNIAKKAAKARWKKKSP